MHYVTAKGILSAKNGMNIYRGCTHGCIYCDSRSDCYRMEHAFDDVEVKANAVELLEAALKKKRKKCMLGMGSMSDPYMPLENSLGFTRRTLETAYKYGFGMTLITKSDGYLRDLNLLKKINARAKCVIQTTLTTFDDSLARIIEPFAPTTKARFEAIKVLRDNGIPVVVWLCPILPYINDTRENLIGILEYCKEAEVKGVINFGMGLTLRGGNREYFYSRLDKHFPGLKQKYLDEFESSYCVSSPNNTELMRVFHKFLGKNGIMHDNAEIFDYLTSLDEKPPQITQISIFDGTKKS